MKQVLSYLKYNEEKILEDLHSFLKIPSISTDSAHKQDMYQCVDFLTDYLRESGFSSVETIETAQHPMVFARYNSPVKDAPTVLIYGHYDVQPVDPLEEWETDPFSPEIKNNRIYARGASDDKGQVMMHLAVLRAYLQVHGSFPLNVKVLIEGEEEIGSPSLHSLIQERDHRFESDFYVISDSAMIAENQPTILYGLKGFLGFELVVRGPERDLHSGVYGGAIKNPAFALMEVIAKLKNDKEEITIPHFYDDVEPLSEEERKRIQQVPEEDYRKTTGITETVSEQSFTSKEHTMARPTLEINGLTSGYQGEGTKTIIPSKASAKITCRLVPYQDPEKILQQIEAYVKDIAPKGVTVEVLSEELSAKAVKFHPDHSVIKKAAESYAEIFGQETVFVRMGGSIPIVEWLYDVYNQPIVLFGFGTPSDHIHSPNESFPLLNFTKGMQALVHYWSSFQKGV